MNDADTDDARLIAESPAASLVVALRAVVKKLGRGRRLRREIAMMQALPDHVMYDIGLPRSDIDAECRGRLR